MLTGFIPSSDVGISTSRALSIQYILYASSTYVGRPISWRSIVTRHQKRFQLARPPRKITVIIVLGLSGERTQIPAIIPSPSSSRPAGTPGQDILPRNATRQPSSLSLDRKRKTSDLCTNTIRITPYSAAALRVISPIPSYSLVDWK